VTSHILPELSRICDQVAIITHGRLRAFGTLEEIMREVSQQRMIEVLLAGAEHVERAVEAVRPRVEADAEVQGFPAEAAVRFRSSRSEQQLGQLLAELVGAGLPITQFRELQSDLEEAFLSVTRETAGDGRDSRRGPAAEMPPDQAAAGAPRTAVAEPSGGEPV
jgi:ABC-2 type transport system ATP-binding protein